jgi:hypothetical protein
LIAGRYPGFVARRQNEERSISLDTLRDEILSALSARQAASERENNALRAELAELRRLLDVTALQVDAPARQRDSDSASR